MGRRLVAACSCCLILGGCAVVKRTDITDASFKRHQSVSVLGWPVYTRVTDRERGASPHLAVKPEPTGSREILAAELLSPSLDQPGSPSAELHPF